MSYKHPGTGSTPYWGQGEGPGTERESLGLLIVVSGARTKRVNTGRD